MRDLLLGVIVGASPWVLGAWGAPAWSNQGNAHQPIIDPNDFIQEIDNPYYPLTPGAIYVYEGAREGSPLRAESYVTFETRHIMGVTCRVIHDRMYVAGVLQEDTLDWFAQDREGNVWYFGEAVQELDEEGTVVSTEGSWEAGVNSAQPGIVMRAHPQVGETYRQEYAVGIAEDEATILALDATAAVPLAPFKDCLKTRDFSPLDPSVAEEKCFAPGVGFIRSVLVQGGVEWLELVSVKAAPEPPASGSIVINEVLAHSHHTAPDWIELYNTTGRPIDIGGWFLSNKHKDPTQYQIPDGTVVPARGYIVFYENLSFGDLSAPGCRVPFALSEAGDGIDLTSGYQGQPTAYSEQESFGGSETGISFGRFSTSDGRSHFVSLLRATPGAANAPPRVGPVVINEIMYHSPGAGGAEYVELLNLGGTEVKLYEAATQLSWRLKIKGLAKKDSGKLVFTGSSDLTIGPGQYLLIVEDPMKFRAAYSVPAGTQIYAWPTGTLTLSVNEMDLAKGISIDAVDIGWVPMEQINYSDGAHPAGNDLWPKDADGKGVSLSRICADKFGDDPANWKAAPPSPGRPNP
jgi:hypothetical protein